jgi:hypothetical protein
MFLVTFAAFVAVCVYAGFTYLQVCESRKGNDLANKAFIIINRPYLVWTADYPVGITDKGVIKEWGIRISVKNFGKTPAVNTVLKICDPIIRNDNMEPNFSCVLSTAPSLADAVIGPDQEVSFFGTRLSDETYSETMNDTKFVYVFGYLTYKDNMTNDTHRTRFCHRISKLPPQATGASNMLEVSCSDPRWTCIDNGCVDLTQ